MNIDWDWVRTQLLEKERIGRAGPDDSKKAILECTDECLEAARLLARPVIVSSLKKIAGFKPGAILLENGMALSGKELSSYMKGATELYLFLVTIGSSIENAASDYMKAGDSLHGYLMDRIGSFAVESLADRTEKDLRGAYSDKNLSVSMRFSPGYCDWPIEEQFKLAKLLDFAKAGVRLTEGCMMEPKKSISAACAIGSKGLFAKVTSPCAVCNLNKKCDYRRA